MGIFNRSNPTPTAPASAPTPTVESVIRQKGYAHVLQAVSDDLDVFAENHKRRADWAGLVQGELNLIVDMLNSFKEKYGYTPGTEA